MRSTLFVLAILLSQATVAQDVVQVEVGQTYGGSLETGSEGRYTIDLEADQFVAGWANQISVDVVISVYTSEGERINRTDVSGRGAEPFQFQVEEADTYGIAIEPFEDEEGDYAFTIDRVESIATEPEGLVDQLMAAFDRDISPGVVVGVVRDGELSFAKAYGMANLTHGIPFTVNTPTNIGSTSKQFTGFALALLADRGELNLDDDVRDHIPELPDFGETVTLRHLLTHTSGYREFLNTLSIGGRRMDLGDGIETRELIEIVQHQPELQNSPASEWNYNNTAFGLLAEVVARVSGQSFPEWMEENVFEPLGMTHSTVRANNHQIIEGASQGYVHAEDGGWQDATDLGGAMGAGGIYTTVGDLAKWINNYYTAELGGRHVIEQMTTPYTLSDGEDTGYGFGIFIDDINGVQRLQHGGADTAHRSSFSLFPEHNAGLIVLSNFPGVPRDASGRLAEAFFADLGLAGSDAESEEEQEQAREAPREEAADARDSSEELVFNPADFDGFAGRYEMEEVPGFILTFRREGDQFFTQATGQQEIEIFHAEGTTFELRTVDASVTFHPESDGSVGTVTLHQNGDHVANRVEDGGTIDLSSFVGRYFSEEVEAFYTIALQEGELVLQHRRQDDIALTHNNKDSFTGGFPIATIDFERDDEGEITGFRAGSGRARDIWFEKIN